MKKILSVGFKIPTLDDDELEFGANLSLSDGDIVVFSPNLDGTYGWEYEYYNGKPVLNKSSSFDFIKHSEHWKRELNAFLTAGKTVFIILKQFNEFHYFTGEKRNDGTPGRPNIKNIVNTSSNYRFLPVSLNIVHVEGKSIIPASPLFKEFYENFKSNLVYSSIIEGAFTKEQVIFTTKNKDKTLGITLKVGNGNLIFLPEIVYSIEDFTYKNNEKRWNSAGIQWGKKFVNHLIEIDKALSYTSAKTPSPSWVNNSEFELQHSVSIKCVIDEKLKEIESLRQDVERHQTELSKSEQLKDLLFETGKPLEQAVIDALTILGYKAENYTDGNMELDQVIISPEGHRFIGECEGKDNQAIDISKFRQLQDLLNEDFQREEVDDKAYGILFGNPQRITNPSDRKLDFTDKCKRAAKREVIALVKTSDLYLAVRYLLENDDDEYRKECRRAIYEQLGEIVKFPSPPTAANSALTKAGRTEEQSATNR